MRSELQRRAEGDVHHRIADLARRLHSGPPEDSDSILQRIVEYAVSEVPGADYAGVTYVTSATELHTPATTHPYPALLDAIQQRHRQGPCLTAVWTQHTVRLNDLASDHRWPFYQRDALKVSPIRSILSFRMFTSDKTFGALNLYANRPHAFADEAEEIGYVLATHASLAWDTSRRENQFRSALASRDTIGQAKGILMVRFNIDAVQAFELLKRLSQESNTRLADVAEKLTTMDNFDKIGSADQTFGGINN
jgi:GAF domain-containing protein